MESWRRRMTVYNKLVRDKIPALIRSQGERPIFRTLDEQEYLHCLEKKLDEEVAEFHRDWNAEELADILEVVFALAEALGCPEAKLQKIRREKGEKRGTFRDKVFLEGKEG